MISDGKTLNIMTFGNSNPEGYQSRNQPTILLKSPSSRYEKPKKSRNAPKSANGRRRKPDRNSGHAVEGSASHREQPKNVSHETDHLLISDNSIKDMAACVTAKHPKIADRAKN